MRVLAALKRLHYLWHVVLAAAVRALFICYGTYHDENFLVPYTDVDYRVFTDASRHVLRNGSPYDRHTYRYSPLMAFLLVPNVLVHHSFGKVLFSVIDLIIGLLIRSIVKNSLHEYECHSQKTESTVLTLDSGNRVVKPNLKYLRSRKKSKSEKSERATTKSKSEIDVKSDISMMIWLYNPISVAISTRGNSDSIAGLFVLSTIYLLQCKKKSFAAGVLHGISVHFRLYPIVYSLAFFMSLSKFSHYSTNRDTKIVVRKDKKHPENDDESKKTIFKKVYLTYLLPNVNQLRLISGCLTSLACLTFAFYTLYGRKFIDETYLYHLTRKDTRHNFSLFFYLQYLTAGVKNIGLWQKVLIVLPQLILLVTLSVRYGLNRYATNFSVLTLTITMVVYNTVLTSQYFVWILVVLPLCVWQIKISAKSAVFLVAIWLAAQAAWLMPAYFLEFQGQNTFLFVWLQSVSFFCANVAILGRMIMNYVPVKKLKV